MGIDAIGPLEAECRNICSEIERILPVLDKCAQNLSQLEALDRQRSTRVLTAEEVTREAELYSPFTEATTTIRDSAKWLRRTGRLHPTEFAELGDCSALLTLASFPTPATLASAVPVRELCEMKKRIENYLALRTATAQALPSVPENAVPSAGNSNGCGEHSDRAENGEPASKTRDRGRRPPEGMAEALKAAMRKRLHKPEDAPEAIGISPATCCKLIYDDGLSKFDIGTLKCAEAYINATEVISPSV